MEIRCEWTQKEDDLKQIQTGLQEVIVRDFGPPLRQNFAWVVRDEQQTIIGGVSGYVHWQWSYIAQLWVHENHRQLGLGKKLLQTVEAWSLNNKNLGIYIDTFDVQIQKFYERNGFKNAGSIPNFPQGGNRYFLFKPL